MSNVQILTLMLKKIEFLFRKKLKHASRAKNSSYLICELFTSSINGVAGHIQKFVIQIKHVSHNITRD